jgi:hypothetical protein
VLNLYAGDFAAPSLIGDAPVGTPGAVVQDSSTCVLDIGHSYIVEEVGTGSLLNLALTFKNTGAINTYAQGFDRQNAGGAPQQSAIGVPANSFTLAPIGPVSVQQGGSAAVTLNVPVTGNPSGPVTVTSSGPSGVILASPGAPIGTGMLAVTGNNGSETYTTNVPVTVTPSTQPVAGTFALSGAQIDTSAQSGTFTVALTPLDGLAPSTPISIYVDVPSESSTVSASLSASTVNANGSFTAYVAIAAGVNQADYSGAQCAVVDAVIAGSGNTPEQISLCVNASGNSNSTFSIPLPPPDISVPSGSTLTIYGTVSGSNPNFSQSVSCPGVANCTASATFGTVVNGVVPITINPGNVPAGSVYEQTFTANEQSIGCPFHVVGGSGTYRYLYSSEQPFTYNNGSPGPSFQYSTTGFTTNQLQSCSAGPNINAVIDVTGSTTVNLAFVASAGTAARDYAVTCTLDDGTTFSGTAVEVYSYASQTTSIGGLQVSQAPTQNPIDGTAPTPVPLVSTSKGLAYATSLSTCGTPTQSSVALVCVLMGAGNLTVTALSPQPPSGVSQIQWVMWPDPANFTIKNSVNTPVLNGSPGQTVTFQPNVAGDFLLIAYVDANGNGQFDPGEQLGTLQIAIVQATIITSSSSFTVANTLVGTQLQHLLQGIFSGIASDPSGLISSAPMQLTAWYWLQGGGLGGTIGNGAIMIGDVGNLVTSDTFEIDYLGTPNGVGNEAPGGSIPMLDTQNLSNGVAQSGGGITAFRKTSQLATGPAPSLPSPSGSLLGIQSGDAPTFQWLLVHPTVSQEWDLTDGGIGFIEYVAGFSASFPNSYAALSQASWSVSASGDNMSSIWTPDADASVTKNYGLTVAVQGKMQVLGLSYGTNNSIVYTTTKN